MARGWNPCLCTCRRSRLQKVHRSGKATSLVMPVPPGARRRRIYTGESMFMGWRCRRSNGFESVPARRPLSDSAPRVMVFRRLLLLFPGLFARTHEGRRFFLLFLLFGGFCGNLFLTGFLAFLLGRSHGLFDGFLLAGLTRFYIAR